LPRLYFGEAQVDPPNAQYVRILIFQDTQTNQTLSASENVVSIPTGNAPMACLFMRNPEYAKRFNSLWTTKVTRPQHGVTQNGTNNFSAASETIPFEAVINFKTPVEINYRSGGNDGSVNQIQDNSFGILAVSAGDNVFTNDASIIYTARLRFYG